MRAYMGREVTIDDLLGSQLDEMADSVNLASKMRLERTLAQITQGNPPHSSVTLRGAQAGSKVGQDLLDSYATAPDAAGTSSPDFINPFTCGLVLTMESAGPGGKEEALYSFAVRQELATASGTPMERFQYCGSSWGAAASSFAPVVFVPRTHVGRDPHTGPYNLYPSSFSSASRTGMGWHGPGLFNAQQHVGGELVQLPEQRSLGDRKVVCVPRPHTVSSIISVNLSRRRFP